MMNAADFAADSAADFAASFDRPIDRAASDSLKWGRYAGRDILPLWVADMDFAAPPAVIAALQERVAHGVFGYPQDSPTLAAAVVEHLAANYAWAIDPDWLVWLPGLVTGLNVACRAVEGDVLTATPVYPPFLSAPRLAGRSLRTVELSCEPPPAAPYWSWDWAALAAACTPSTRLFLLCHPHNPVGRAWQDAELRQLAEFCCSHDLIVCADEIHCGLVLDPARRHRPLASIDADIARRSITLMAPSKTYNIPGLYCGWAVIPDAGLRRRYVRTMQGVVPHLNLFGLVAAEAALRHGGDWHQTLLSVLRRNRDRLSAVIARLPMLRMAPVEATALAWIDARGLGVDDPAAYFEAAGLGFSDGRDFAAPGFVRFNFGCPLPTLEEALARLTDAVLRQAD